MAARPAAGRWLRPLRLVPGHAAPRAAPPGALRRLAAGLAAGLRPRAWPGRPHALAARGHLLAAAGPAADTSGAGRATSSPRSSPGTRPRWPCTGWGELLLARDGSTDLSRFDLAGIPRGRIVTGMTGRVEALTTGRPLTAG